MKANFWRSLAAVLAGNLIYLLLEKHLPPKAQHQPFAFDWGLAVDFWICVICYGLIRMIR
jgi:hypothetical protein